MRRLFIGQVTVLLDGWEHLRTVLRIQTETVDGKDKPPDERYLISSLPAYASPLTIGCSSPGGIGAWKLRTKSSTTLSKKTITLGPKPVRVRLS